MWLDIEAFRHKSNHKNANENVNFSHAHERTIQTLTIPTPIIIFWNLIFQKNDLEGSVKIFFSFQILQFFQSKSQKYLLQWFVCYFWWCYCLYGLWFSNQYLFLRKTSKQKSLKMFWQNFPKLFFRKLHKIMIGPGLLNAICRMFTESYICICFMTLEEFHNVLSKIE